MYIIKNALKNVYRNIGRNMLLAGITVLIISMSCIALVIHNNTNIIANDYKSKLSSEIIMNTDYDELDKEIRKNPDFLIPEMSNDIIHKIAKSKYLQKTEYYTQMDAIADDVKYPIEVPKEDQSGFAIAGKKVERSRIPQYVLMGYSDVRNDKDFKSKDRTLVKGEFPKNDTDCLISDTVARLNNLKPGDKIKVKNAYYNNRDGKPLEEMTLKVSGIYNTKDKANAENSDHQIFVKYNILTDERYAFEPSLKANFFLKSPKDLEAFTKEAYEAGLSKFYKLSTDDVAYQSFVQPVEQMSKIAVIFLLIVLILGGVILVLLSMLAVRERKYEIGVLRAMGMKKWNIAAQMILESMFIIAICLIAGILIGSLFAQPLTNTMLQSSMSSGASSPFVGAGQYMGGLATEHSAITHIDAKLSISTIIQLIMISLGLVIISGSIGAFYAMKYEPMKILRERN